MTQGAKIKALFLDRDGVINEDYHYPHKPEHITFKPGIFDLCRQARDKGYTLFVMTNQAGVARGKFSEQDVQSLHEWMRAEFARQGIDIAAFYYCPYHKNAVVDKYRADSDLRKPKPGMFIQAAQDHNIDLSQSLMLGDKVSDRIEHPQLKSVIIKSQYVTEGYDIGELGEAASYL